MSGISYRELQRLKKIREYQTAGGAVKQQPYGKEITKVVRNSNDVSKYFVTVNKLLHDAKYKNMLTLKDEWSDLFITLPPHLQDGDKMPPEELEKEKKFGLWTKNDDNEWIFLHLPENLVRMQQADREMRRKQKMITEEARKREEMEYNRIQEEIRKQYAKLQKQKMSDAAEKDRYRTLKDELSLGSVVEIFPNYGAGDVMADSLVKLFPNYGAGEVLGYIFN